jgi:hypothetical protein
MLSGKVTDSSVKNDFFNHRCQLQIGSNKFDSVRYHTGKLILPFRKFFGMVVEVKDNQTQKIYWVNKNSLCKCYRGRNEDQGLSNDQIINALSGITNSNPLANINKSKPAKNQLSIASNQLANINKSKPAKNEISMSKVLTDLKPDIVNTINANKVGNYPYSLILVANIESGDEKYMVETRVEPNDISLPKETLLGGAIDGVLSYSIGKLGANPQKQQKIQITALMNNQKESVKVGQFVMEVGPQSRFEETMMTNTTELLIHKREIPRALALLFKDSTLITKDKMGEYATFLGVENGTKN